MSGDSFISSVIPGSAVVFHFDEAYGLNQKQVSYDTAYNLSSYVNMKMCHAINNW